MAGTFSHRSVLLDECIEGLNIRPDGIYIDGTLGRGGHSEQIAKRLTEGGRLICIDRDIQAIQEAGERLAPYADRITYLHGNFGDLETLLEEAGIPQADGMLFDLGVSSPSWTTRTGASPTCTMPPWTCAWTGTRPSPPGRW